jgi:two-component system, chemotaxis family, CheB/CheR fusion protein
MATKKNPQTPLYIAAIGASAGGLEPLQKLIAHIPKGTRDLAVIIVQHLSPNYKSMLVQSLGSQTYFEVVEAKNATLVKSETIYITPPDREISIAKGKLLLNKPPRTASPRPSINNLFTALAEDQKEKAMGIILSGTGTDGAYGLKKIEEAGGITIIQDPKTAKFGSMPQAALETANVDFVLDPEKIGEQLAILTSRGGKQTSIAVTKPNKEKIFEDIVELLAQEKGTDLTNYKQGTLFRRIKKRMADLKYSSANKYYGYLKNNSKEVEELFNMMMIGVTSFFRDPHAFKAIEKCIVALVENKVDAEPLRVWIPGCATGQEAYSIAILIVSAIKKKKHALPVQIFATDLNENSLSVARKGIYPHQEIQRLPAEVQKHYFIHRTNDTYEVSKTIRSMVMFSKHDLTNNPPFLKLDLIVCRNLLIYFNARLQEFVFSVFYSALNPNGYLWLGKSESIGHFRDLFSTVKRDAKIYQRKAGTPLRTIRYTPLKIKESFEKKAQRDFTLPDMLKETLYKIYEFPYVVVNDDMDILEISGDVSNYVGLKQGHMNASLIKLAHKDLQTELRSLVQKSIKEDKVAENEKKKYSLNGKDHFVKIIVRPLLYSSKPNQFFLIVFEEIDSPKDIPPKASSKPNKKEATTIKDLELELQATKDDLQGFIERLEDSNSQLQSLNEELQSSNEELKISNEELETANEELQSANEEINIAYIELKAANEALEEQETLLLKSEANIKALINNTLQAFILLDKDYSIIAFNKVALHTIKNVFEADLSIGKNFKSLFDKKMFKLFAADFETSLNGKSVRAEHDLADQQQNPYTFIFNFSPVLNANSKIESVSFSMLDVTERNRAKAALIKSEKLVESVFHTADIGLAIVNEKGKFIKVNQGFSKLLGYSIDELTGKPYHKIMAPGHGKKSESHIPQHESETEYRVVSKAGKILDVFTTSDLFINPEGEKYLIKTMRDISDEKKFKELLFNTEVLMHTGSFEYNLIAQTLTCTDEVFNILELGRDFHLTVKAIARFAHKQDMPKIKKAVQDVIHHRKQVDFEFRIVTAKGKEKWIQIKSYPLLTKSKIVGLRGTAIDVTGQKMAEVEIERLSWVARHTNNGVMITDSKGKIEWVNNSFEKMVGHTFSDVQGKTIGGIFEATGKVKETLERTEQQIQKKHSTTGELLHFTKQGEQVWLRLDMAPIRQPNGANNFIGIFTDLTELIKTQEIRQAQQSLEERQNLLDAMAGNFPDGILGVINQNLSYIFVGGSELKKLGHKVSDVIGDKIFDNIYPEANEYATPFLEKVFKGNDVQFDVNVGDNIYLVSAVPLTWEDNLVTRALVVIQNITKRKKAEEAMRIALQKQQELNELKSQFITLASHEFRTPLSTIYSSADLIKRFNELNDGENIIKHSNRIVGSVKSLTEILNEFLSLSKIEEGVVRNNPVELDVKEFCKELTEEIATSAKKGQVIQYEHQGEPNTILVDVQHLKNILHNLLSNAVKYSPEDKPIKLSCTRTKGAVTFVVKDEGIGIPEEDKVHLFDSFFRAKNASNIQGTGLGLHIIKRYLAIMGGTVSFESTLGKGSTFTITLPQPQGAP